MTIDTVTKEVSQETENNRLSKREIERERANARSRFKTVIKRREKKTGDKHGEFEIVIALNRKKVAVFPKKFEWLLDTYKCYNELLEKNRANLGIKKEFNTKLIVSVGTEMIPSHYELLIVENVKKSKATSKFTRSREGVVTENIAVTEKNVKSQNIIDKSEWFLEDKFYVFGYNPKKDGKTYRWIYNYILDDIDIHGSKVVCLLNNKLIIQKTNDIDLVIGNDIKQAEVLYDKLYTDMEKAKINKVAFLGKLDYFGAKKEWYSRLKEKTGWGDHLIKKITRKT